MSDNYKYTIIDGIDHLIDEKGNSFISMRKMYWGDNPDSAKLEIRKYYNNSDGSEKPSKGVTFLTEDGPHNLTHALVGMGYGNTTKVLESLSERDDFRKSLNNVLNENDEFYDNSVPEDVFVGEEELFDY